MNAGQDLREALIEARRWIGDGDLGDGLHRDIWTPRYREAIDMIDAALTAAQPDSSTVAQGDLPACSPSDHQWVTDPFVPHAMYCLKCLRSAQPAPVTDAVLEVIAKHVGRTSNIFRYIRDDLAALSPPTRIYQDDCMGGETEAPSAPVDVDLLIKKMLPPMTLFAETEDHLADLRSRAKAHLLAAIPAAHAAQDVQS